MDFEGAGLVCRPSQKLLKHQADAADNCREWHYIRVMAGSRYQLLNTSGSVSQAKSLMGLQEIGFGARGLCEP